MGEQLIRRRVPDLVQYGVGVPGLGVGHLDIAQAEDLRRQVEHSCHDPIQREVLGDLELVDSVFGSEELLVVVAPVPQLDLAVAGVLFEKVGDALHLLPGESGERRDQICVERRDGRRTLRHLLLHPVVGPGREPEDLGASTPKTHRLFEEGTILLGGAAVEFL